MSAGSAPRSVLLAAVLLHAPAASTAQVVDTLAVDTLAADTLGVDTPGADPRRDTDSVPAPDSRATPYAGPLPAPAADRLAHLATASTETPGDMGFVAAGMAEAAIAAEHVSLAGRNAADLSNMQRHMSHVLHAIDPTEVGQGPGMGFGVVAAARGILLEIEQVQGLDGLPGVVSFHAPYVARAARGTLGRADEAIGLARQIQRATSAAAAHRLVERLADTVRAMAYGSDRDEDGRIGHTEDEMGLAQVRYHLRPVERLTR